MVLKLRVFGARTCHNPTIPTVVRPDKACGAFGANHVKVV